MSRRLIDETGNTYGKLTVKSKGESRRIGRTAVFATWDCVCDCGQKVNVLGTHLRSGKSTTCGCGKVNNRRAGDNPRYQGGKHITSQGYRRVWDPDNESANQDGYILEHRKAMQEHLGRPLRKGESVHHINGVKTDNRLENLELWVSNHPAGCRVPDLVAWARSIIELYGDEDEPTSN